MAEGLVDYGGAVIRNWKRSLGGHLNDGTELKGIKNTRQVKSWWRVVHKIDEILIGVRVPGIVFHIPKYVRKSTRREQVCVLKP